MNTFSNGRIDCADIIFITIIMLWIILLNFNFKIQTSTVCPGKDIFGLVPHKTLMIHYVMKCLVLFQFTTLCWPSVKVC